MYTMMKVLLTAVSGVTLLQVSPIRIDPWSWLARQLGRAINRDMMTRMERLEQAVVSLRETVDERAAVSARVRILRFGDEILHGVHHSKEHFDQILQDITAYEKYCETHPDFLNNMTVLTTRHIKETYSDCFEQQTFL